MKLLSLGFFVAIALGGAACATPAEPSEGDEPTGEAAQEIVSCSSDCSGVRDASPISVTCVDWCSATNTEVVCDGVTTACAARESVPSARQSGSADSKVPDQPWFVHPSSTSKPPRLR